MTSMATMEFSVFLIMRTIQTSIDIETYSQVQFLGFSKLSLDFDSLVIGIPNPLSRFQSFGH
jgi:hypothetical protein